MRYQQGYIFSVTPLLRFQVVTMGHDGKKPNDAHKPSDNHGDKHDNKDNAEKNAHKARGEASNELESGSLNDTTKATRQKQFESGKSGITDYKFPPAKGVFGDAVHAPLTKEAEHKRDADFKKHGWGDSNDLQGAKTEHPAAKTADQSYNDHLAYLQGRSENYHRDIAQHLKDGMHSYSLPDLFANRGTAISDVYEHSTKLKDGETGKSPTLESAVARLRDCPWADKIKFKFDGSVTNPDYNERESTITINPNDSVAKQIETFVHEAYHATHQGLNDLFGGKQPVSKEDFVRIMADHEVHSFEAEIKAHDELSSTLPGASPVTFEWKDKNEVAQPTKDLGELYHSKGISGLHDFVIEQAKTRMDINGHKQLATYRQYYESHYDEYSTNFDAAHKQYQEWFTKDPAVQKKIQQNAF